MAEIKFVGFVDDWKRADASTGTQAQSHPNWAMRVNEKHSKKVDGQLVPSGVTRRTVKAGWDKEAERPVQIDFTQFRVGDRVEVSGIEVSEEYEFNGRKASSLVVKATSVRVVPPAKKGQGPLVQDLNRDVNRVVESVFGEESRPAVIDDLEAPF